MIPFADRLNVVKEYYFSKKLREVRGLIAEGKPIINLGIGSPDFKPDSTIERAIADSLNDEKAHQYQSYQGLPELRKSIAEFYKQKFQVSLDYNSEILPLMGSKEGIMHISMAFLNKGDLVLIPNPGYPTYASVTKLVGAIPIHYELISENNWLPDFKSLENENLKKVKIMWVNYPHMPTGTVASKQALIDLVDFTKKHDILLINDNPYSFILNNKPLSILEIEGSKDNCLELNSLSKTFNMAGWRVGMVLGSKYYIDNILKVKSNMDSGMFYGIQKGAIAALNLDDYWFQNLNSTYRKRREIVWKIANKLHCTYDKKAIGLFVWAKLQENENDFDFSDNILNKYHIFITPGSIFGSKGSGYIRISLCADINILQKALDRLI